MILVTFAFLCAERRLLELLKVSDLIVVVEALQAWQYQDVILEVLLMRSALVLNSSLHLNI